MEAIGAFAGVLDGPVIILGRIVNVALRIEAERFCQQPVAGLHIWEALFGKRLIPEEYQMIVFLCIHAETVLHSFGGMDIEESEPVAEDFLCVSVLNEPDKDSLSNQISLSFF
jgi:hypothetical protein